MKFRDLFYLNKSDRNSVIFLVIIVAIVLAVLIFSGEDNKKQLADDKDDTEIVYPLRKKEFRKSSRRIIDDEPIACEEQKVVLTKFDPNTADSSLLLSLGLSRWQVRNIYKYRASGGVYKKKSDFARLYGLTVKKYRELEPYIVISDDYRDASTLFQDKEVERDTVKYPIKIKEGTHVYLNVSDTTQLKKVPGIGSAYARAIVNYGNRLGGYVDISQLMEIEGFPKESLEYFELSPISVKKININRESVSKMKRHPYITFFMAKGIADHRRLNGPISDISQLKFIKDFSPKVIEKLRPYVEYK